MIFKPKKDFRVFDRLRKRLPGKWGNVPVTVPVVRLQGAIGMASPLRPGLSLANVAQQLDKAFSIDGPAVALIVNSPGGSPVQSRLIHARIRALAEEKKKDLAEETKDSKADAQESQG